MIGAEETIAPLKWLEACRGEEFSEKIEETTFNTLEAVRKIISEAEHYFGGNEEYPISRFLLLLGYYLYLSYYYPNLFSK